MMQAAIATTSPADPARISRRSGAHRDDRVASPAVVYAVAIVYFLLAFRGIVSDADAALWLLAAALLGQKLRPFLLLLAASIQDAPGLSYLWSYIDFAGIAGLMVFDAALRPPLVSDPVAELRLQRVTKMAIALAAYGICVAWAQNSLGGFPQSDERPYLMVGALTVVMVLSGYFSHRVIDFGKSNRRLLGGLAMLCLLHALFIGLLQIPFGQAIYRSGSNLAQVEATRQLVEDGAIGFARINGPFLSPNTLGYEILLLAMIVIVTRYDSARFRVACVYVIAGAAAVLLSMSKAALGYYGLSCLVLSTFLIGRAGTFVAMVAAAAALPFILTSNFIQLVFDVFRFQEGTLGTRQWAWAAVIDHLRPSDWIFGIGVGAWPDFFTRYIGHSLSDPHSLVLSLPGSYGVLGVVFFLLLLWTFQQSPVSPAAGVSRRLGWALLVLLFLVKDLAALPSVLGNTPQTYLVWLLMGLVLCAEPGDPGGARIKSTSSHEARKLEC
jgi:hypothetical protein